MSRPPRLDPPELNLTAMVDVVFLLLIFFLITGQPATALTHLEILRATSAPGPRSPQLVLLQLTVEAQRTLVDGRPVDPAHLDPLLSRAAQLNPDQTVLIRCASDAPHARLIELLDRCQAHSLSNLSVVSGPASGGHAGQPVR